MTNRHKHPIKITLRTPLLKHMNFKFSPTSLPKGKSILLPLCITSRLRTTKEETNSLSKSTAQHSIIEQSIPRRHKKYYDSYILESMNRIIYNDNGHLVSIFKDYLIYDDSKELLFQYYNHERSIGMLKDLIKRNDKKFIFSTYMLCENKIFKKASVKKAKIRKIRGEDLKQRADGSTFFGTSFIDELEEASSSLSRITTNSFETSINEIGKIRDLLLELNKHNRRHNVYINMKKIIANNMQYKKIRKGEIMQKKKFDVKDLIPLNKVTSSRKDRTRIVLSNAKPFSSNAHYLNENFLLESKSPVVTYNAFGLRLSSQIRKSIRENQLLAASLINSKCEDRKCTSTLPFKFSTQNCKEKFELSDYLNMHKKRNSHCLKEVRSPLLMEIGRRSNENEVNAKSILKKLDNSRAKVKILNAREQLQKIVNKN